MQKLERIIRRLFHFLICATHPCSWQCCYYCSDFRMSEAYPLVHLLRSLLEWVTLAFSKSRSRDQSRHYLVFISLHKIGLNFLVLNPLLSSKNCFSRVWDGICLRARTVSCVKFKWAFCIQCIKILNHLHLGSSLAVQWLPLSAFMAGGLG